jgi:hypothetical protein
MLEGQIMQIKYLRDAPLGKAGDIANVDDNVGNVLIILGYAEIYESKKRKTKADNQNTATDNDADFGSE